MQLNLSNLQQVNQNGGVRRVSLHCGSGATPSADDLSPLDTPPLGIFQSEYWSQQPLSHSLFHIGKNTVEGFKNPKLETMSPGLVELGT
jgi:hypothetical protein